MLSNELTRVAPKYHQLGVLFCLLIWLRMVSHENFVLVSRNGSVLIYLRGFSYLFCCPELLPNHK